MSATKRSHKKKEVEKSDRPRWGEPLESLVNEYNGEKRHLGKKIKMSEMRLSALRTKLVLFYESGDITEEERELMLRILKKDRAIGRMVGYQEYILNTIESAECEKECVVKTDDCPIVHHLSKGMRCRYTYDEDYNNGKGKSDSIGRFYVYVPRVVPTEHQLSVATVRKENLGHPTTPGDYPAPRTLIHRLSLNEKEFHQWFEIDEDILTEEYEEEEEEEKAEF
jgi:hypothetical protein